MNLLLAFMVSFAFVALKAFQQLNVVHGQFGLVVPTSILMGAAEVYLVGAVVRDGFLLVLPMGLGGGLGCIFSMLLHRWLRRWREED